MYRSVRPNHDFGKLSRAPNRSVYPQRFRWVRVVLRRTTPKLSETSFKFPRIQPDEDLDRSGLTEWQSIDELCHLARRATGGVTVVFDSLTKPGWVPRRDSTTRMRFMSKFR
ncbi:hypothetical protein BDM02DRAFT_926418 [Thelephora ganbajun]|uniref:Uncharacterized protein n=1 Tax=Thelephora ganbajun TaxID=370292 RepID=A0ACB6Z5A7_THEGA|nr:hypothetical protein BDM02DRAFT_926418 [Thelephora ganbajun]